VFAKKVKNCANVSLDNLYLVLDLSKSVEDSSVIKESNNNTLDSMPNSLFFCLQRS
jgi:hypothetical protein